MIFGDLCNIIVSHEHLDICRSRNNNERIASARDFLAILSYNNHLNGTRVKKRSQHFLHIFHVVLWYLLYVYDRDGDWVDWLSCAYVSPTHAWIIHFNPLLTASAYLWINSTGFIDSVSVCDVHCAWIHLKCDNVNDIVVGIRSNNMRIASKTMNDIS